MFATTIRVHARFEANIGTVIVIDDTLSGITVEFGAQSLVVLGVPIGILFEMDFFETVGGIQSRSTAFDARSAHPERI